MCPSWYKAMYCRPFFPQYFPDYELIIWIDADAWLCNWEAMKLLIRGGEMNGFAIVPEVDRAYPHCFVPRQSVLNNLKQRLLCRLWSRGGGDLPSMPVLNCGVFAMRRDVPYWGIWAEILARALQQGVGPLIEQCALQRGRVQQSDPGLLPAELVQLELCRLLANSGSANSQSAGAAIAVRADFDSVISWIASGRRWTSDVPTTRFGTCG